MAMMQPDSAFKFGKYNGKTVLWVAENDPGYLCWMLKTGFQEFGKEVTEAIFVWEVGNEEEVKRIERSITKKKKEEADNPKVTSTPRVATLPSHDPLPPPVISPSMSAAWGSW